MEVVLLLIILSLTVAVLFLFAFFWAVKSGQYEDDYTPSIRILLDDGYIPTDSEEKENNRKSKIKR